MKQILSAMAAVAFAATLGGTPAGADDLVESWSTQGWDGGAYQDPESGEIYCLLWHEYGDGAEMQLGVDEYGYYMVLVDPEYFEFLSDEPFDTPVRIDDFYPIDFEAYAEGADALVIDLGTDVEVLELLANGERLTLDDWDIWYGLAGSADAIGALNDCYGL